MDQQTITKIQELIQQGEKLAPEGGHEFSGYNAKMQSQYLMWRKSCLDTITKIGEKANPLREKITKDENGAYFYQNSAQLILDVVKQSVPLAEAEMKKSAPAPAPAAAPAPKPAAAPAPAPAPKVEPPAPKPAPQPAAAPVKQEAPKAEPVKAEEAKPEPPKAAAQPAAPAPAANQVLVLSSSETELQNQLSNLLHEMGIEGIRFQRGTAADAIVGFLEQYPTVKYAYYLYNPDDINSAMFELGYLIGKVGSGRVCCIHQKDDAPPKGIPGIMYKEIVVKLEEISFGLIKDLKAAGYTVTF
jgi:hypothetical protein